MKCIAYHSDNYEKEQAMSKAKKNKLLAKKKTKDISKAVEQALRKVDNQELGTKNEEPASAFPMKEYPPLTKLGISVENQMVNMDPKDSRHFEWEHQREEYGFDERETWAMDYVFAQWLYIHVHMFKQFDMYDHEIAFEFKGKELSFEDALDKLERWLAYAVKHYYDAGDDFPKSVKALKRLQKSTHLFAEMIPAMWW